MAATGGRGARDRRRREAERPVLVTGATGFVGGALVPELLAAGLPVRAATRALRAPAHGAVEWVALDLGRPADLPRALDGVETAYFLVHGMASGSEDYAADERRAAEAFSREAERSGVRRIVYLGGVAPRGAPSRHLGSRLAVGEVLRAGRVAALELRASMIVGTGGTSWQIVRDLALRLPAVVLPAWAASRTCPIALDDVVQALLAARTLPLDGAAWFDVPGPEVLSIAEILERVARLRGRSLPAVRMPLPSPRLSTVWLKLVSDAHWPVVRELVQGLAHDLLPRDDRFWTLARLPARLGFDDAARRALAGDRPVPGLRGALAAVEEALVDWLAPRRRADADGAAGPAP